jgi:hypothetical protein
VISQSTSALALIAVLLLSSASPWGGAASAAPCACCDAQRCTCDEGGSKVPVCCGDHRPTPPDSEEPDASQSLQGNETVADGYPAAAGDPAHAAKDPGAWSRHLEETRGPATYLIGCVLRR